MGPSPPVTDADPMSMERDLLMLSQRLMPLSSMVPTVMLPHTDMDTHMPMDMVLVVLLLTQSSPQGLRGKRSAEPVLAYGLPYAPIVPVTGSTYGYGPSGYGISQGHPGAAVSHQFVSRLH